MSFKVSYLTFHGYVLARSPKAIKFQANTWEEPEWVPMSQIEERSLANIRVEEECTVKINKWLCDKNGWEE